MVGSFQPIAEVGTQDKQVKHSALVTKCNTKQCFSIAKGLLWWTATADESFGDLGLS